MFTITINHNNHKNYPRVPDQTTFTGTTALDLAEQIEQDMRRSDRAWLSEWVARHHGVDVDEDMGQVARLQAALTVDELVAYASHAYDEHENSISVTA